MYSIKQIKAKNLIIGGNAPVSVQSMTNTDTRNAEATLQQIKQLSDAGCDLVRISVFDKASAGNIRFFRDNSDVPLCADIHFDYRLALLSMENGIHKLRINPGNIGPGENVKKVVDCARMHQVPIRIGVNAGSLEKDALHSSGSIEDAMVKSAIDNIKLLEKEHFYDIVLSLKASDVRTTVTAYRKAFQLTQYPMHLGITEAGLAEESIIKSSAGIGALLLQGIGDTIRISITGDPVEEVKAGKALLKVLGLRRGIRFVSCPTCGRTRINVEQIARKVRETLCDVDKDITVAVMGCVVNGPGESKHADIALCGGDGCAALFIKGQFVRKIQHDYAEELIKCVENYLHDDTGNHNDN